MKLFTPTKFWICVTKRIVLAFINNSDNQSSCPRMLLCNVLRCSVFMPPHGMDVTGTDCTQMPGIGRTFSGYLSMITSSIRVACRNSQFRGTHKFLRVHHFSVWLKFSVVWSLHMFFSDANVHPLSYCTGLGTSWWSECADSCHRCLCNKKEPGLGWWGIEPIPGIEPTVMKWHLWEPGLYHCAMNARKPCGSNNWQIE